MDAEYQQEQRSPEDEGSLAERKPDEGVEHGGGKVWATPRAGRAIRKADETVSGFQCPGAFPPGELSHYQQ